MTPAATVMSLVFCAKCERDLSLCECVFMDIGKGGRGWDSVFIP